MSKKVMEIFGGEEQLFDSVKEECAELIAAISHYKRGRKDAIKEVEKQTADVAFMISQLMYILPSKVRIAILMTENYEKLMKKEEQKNV